jgi:hypothetical protein
LGVGFEKDKNYQFIMSLEEPRAANFKHEVQISMGEI